MEPDQSIGEYVYMMCVYYICIQRIGQQTAIGGVQGKALSKGATYSVACYGGRCTNVNVQRAYCRDVCRVIL